MLEWALFLAIVAGLLLVNGLGVVLTALQLPGTWLIVLASSAVAWWRWEEQMIGWPVLVALLVLAVVGELIEFVAGAVGASHEGGSWRAAGLAIVGSVVGGVVGFFVLWFIPIVGALIGAAVGAGLASVAGDLWAGRAWEGALAAGRGAAVGRLWGAVGKLGVAGVMWVVAAVAVVWP